MTKSIKFQHAYAAAGRAMSTHGRACSTRLDQHGQWSACDPHQRTTSRPADARSTSAHITRHAHEDAAAALDRQADQRRPRTTRTAPAGRSRCATSSRTSSSTRRTSTTRSAWRRRADSALGNVTDILQRATRAGRAGRERHAGPDSLNAISAEMKQIKASLRRRRTRPTTAATSSRGTATNVAARTRRTPTPARLPVQRLIGQPGRSSGEPGRPVGVRRAVGRAAGDEERVRRARRRHRPTSTPATRAALGDAR